MNTDVHLIPESYLIPPDNLLPLLVLQHFHGIRVLGAVSSSPGGSFLELKNHLFLAGCPDRLEHWKIQH